MQTGIKRRINVLSDKSRWNSHSSLSSSLNRITLMILINSFLIKRSILKFATFKANQKVVKKPLNIQDYRKNSLLINWYKSLKLNFFICGFGKKTLIVHSPNRLINYLDTKIDSQICPICLHGQALLKPLAINPPKGPNVEAKKEKANA
ncbi:hypothetical protein BpHYR1_015904 [Brachionus plicatilis]|uniref:Uncharacterized protein n=1 Tax=Brachionus plicatilis TaxID=10195 RepID=A0A3M7RT74_BRAPC|nr:hypothetical protein BpHYR1_015904 [Brachionus plicatilis]